MEKLETAHRDANINEQQYRLLVENSHGIIYAIRPDGCMGFVSPAWTRLLGYRAEQVVGHDFREFVHQDDVAACEAFLHKTVESGEVQRGVIYRVFHADGTMFWHCSNIVPCFNEAHEIISFVGNAVDITEHVLYEAELERRSNELSLLNQTLEQRIEEETERRLRQEKAHAGQARLAAMGEMIAAIAHQWRQPLTAVSALVQNIQVAYDSGRLSKEFVNKTVETALCQCAFMSDTIDEFRGLLQPQKARETFMVRHEIETALNLISSQLTQNGITIGITGGDSTEIILHSFPGEFKQVILNLVSNSKDAIVERSEREAGGAPSGRISIGIERCDGAVHVAICDNGGGISPDIMEQIFDPYFTTKTEGHGTGIGLYTCRMIIEGSMGGTLTMANCDDGACFTIIIPHGEEAQ
jgi:PAS domain S-box-containing protein